MRKHKVLEYGSVIWDPYLTRDIDELERIQRNGTRFVTGDYKSRHEGAVTNMLKNLDLPTKLLYFHCDRVASEQFLILDC
jgi:hypothetical protein